MKILSHEWSLTALALKFGFKASSYKKHLKHLTVNFFSPFLKHFETLQWVLRHCLVRASLCSVWQKRRIVVYVILHDYVNVRVCNPYNPHHTGHNENYQTKHCRFTVGGFGSSTFNSCAIFRLTNTGWMEVCNSTEECTLLSVSWKFDAVSIFGMMVSVSSTHVQQIRCSSCYITEHHRFAYLTTENSNLARFASAFFIVVHFAGSCFHSISRSSYRMLGRREHLIKKVFFSVYLQTAHASLILAQFVHALEAKRL